LSSKKPSAVGVKTNGLAKTSITRA